MIATRPSSAPIAVCPCSVGRARLIVGSGGRIVRSGRAVAGRRPAGPCRPRAALGRPRLLRFGSGMRRPLPVRIEPSTSQLEPAASSEVARARGSLPMHVGTVTRSGPCSRRPRPLTPYGASFPTARVRRRSPAPAGTVSENSSGRCVTVNPAPSSVGVGLRRRWPSTTSGTFTGARPLLTTASTIDSGGTSVPCGGSTAIHDAGRRPSSRNSSPLRREHEARRARARLSASASGWPTTSGIATGAGPARR